MRAHKKRASDWWGDIWGFSTQHLPPIMISDVAIGVRYTCWDPLTQSPHGCVAAEPAPRCWWAGPFVCMGESSTGWSNLRTASCHPSLLTPPHSFGGNGYWFLKQLLLDAPVILRPGLFVLSAHIGSIFALLRPTPQPQGCIGRGGRPEQDVRHGWKAVAENWHIVWSGLAVGHNAVGSLGRRYCLRPMQPLPSIRGSTTKRILEACRTWSSPGDSHRVQCESLLKAETTAGYQLLFSRRTPTHRQQEAQGPETETETEKLRHGAKHCGAGEKVVVQT